MSTWFAASTGTLVSCETRTGSSLTPSRLAHSLESSQAGPDQCSPEPVVFSTSQGALARTPTRKAPAFLIASMRALFPGGGTSWACNGKAGDTNTARNNTARDRAKNASARILFGIIPFLPFVSCRLVDKLEKRNEF